jgi:hypothetical protein
LISARKILSVQVAHQYVILVVVPPMKVLVHQSWMMQVVVYEMKKLLVVSWSHQP